MTHPTQREALIEAVDSFLPLRAMLRREVVALLRRNAAMGGLGLLLVLATGFIWLMGDSPYVMRGLSGTFFTMGLTWGYIISLLLVPTISATAIASERQNNTLDLLLLTLVRERTIVFSKAFAAFGFFLLLCIGVLPIFGVIFFYVGVETSQFVEGVALIFATTIAHASLGVAASASQRSTMRAIVRGISLSALFSAGLLAGLLTLVLFAGSRTAPDDGLLRLCVPFYSISRLLMGPVPVEEIVMSVLFQLMVAVLALAYATVSLARNARRGPTQDPGQSPARRGGRGAARAIRDRANPIYVKEVRAGSLALTQIPRLPALRSSHVVFVSMLVLSIAGFGLLKMPFYDMKPVAFAWGLMMCAVAPAAACAGLIRERGASTYVHLATSLITPRQIVFGHLLASLRNLIVLFLAGACGILASALAGNFPSESMATILFSCALAAAQFPVLAAFGAFAGATFNSLPRAFTISYLLVVLYLALPQALVWLSFRIVSGAGRAQGRFSLVADFAWLLEQLTPPLSLLTYGGYVNPSLLGATILFHLLIFIPIGLLASRMLARVRNL